MKLFSITYLLPVLLWGMIVTCSRETDVAGGTNIPNQIAGIVIDSNGTAVPNILVTLFTENDTVEKIRAVSSIRTDQSGYYRFCAIDNGRYCIECIKPDSTGISLNSGIDIEDSTVLSLRDTLKTPGALTARFKNPLSSVLKYCVRIRHTPYFKTIDNDTPFMFSHLPPGEQTLLITNGNYSESVNAVIACSTVIIHKSTITTIDTIGIDTLKPVNGVIIIDNFYSGSGRQSIDQGWWTFNDVNDGGLSTVVPFGTLDGFLDEPGYGNNGKCAHIKFTFGSNAWPHHVGCGFYFNEYRNLKKAVDISGAKRIEFALKGYGADVRIGLISAILSYRLQSPVGAIDTSWKHYSLDLDSIAQAGGDTPGKLRWSESGQFITEFIFIATTSQPEDSGEIWVDDVKLVY